MLKIFFLSLSLCFPFFVFCQKKQNDHCALFFDKITNKDTLLITISFYHNRNEKVQKVSVFRSENGKFFAKLNYLQIVDQVIELSDNQCNIIYNFEKGVRNQEISSNYLDIAFTIEYSLSFRTSLIVYRSRSVSFDLVKALLE